MLRFRVVSIALLWLALLAGPAEVAQAQKDQRNLHVSLTPSASSDIRVALVIGNSAYKSSPLKNPVNDARDMAIKLRGLGFDVIERNNLTTRQIGGTMRELRNKLTPGSVAIVFYAGHGLQIKGENYLPAVDAEIETEDDVPNQSLALNQVLRVLDDAKTRLNLVFLDACRNNPYARSFRSGESGLAKVSAPSGTLMSFATRPGSVAADGDGRNGLYTSHLLAAIEEPNQPVELMLKRVTTAVKNSSQGRQEPWMEGSIEGDFYFKTVAYSATPEAQNAQKERQQAIDRAVQEAVNAANEKAAKERAELQATMQRMIEQAMAKQTAILESERKLREETLRKSEASSSLPAQTPAPPPAVAIAAPVTPPVSTPPASSRPPPPPQPPVLGQQPATPPVSAAPTSLPSKPVEAAITVAALSPSKTPDVLQAAPGLLVRTPQPGDEWEYDIKEEVFGGNKVSFVWRVKATSASGSLEEFLLKDRSAIEWVFGSEMEALSSFARSGFIVRPPSSGNIPAELNVHGDRGWCAKRLCVLRDLQFKGKETLEVAAGKFDTLRVDAHLFAQGVNTPQVFRMARVSIWYSERNHRLIKQQAQMLNAYGGNGSREVIELQAVREHSAN